MPTTEFKQKKKRQEEGWGVPPPTPMPLPTPGTSPAHSSYMPPPAPTPWDMAGSAPPEITPTPALSAWGEDAPSGPYDPADYAPESGQPGGQAPPLTLEPGAPPKDVMSTPADPMAPALAGSPPSTAADRGLDRYGPNTGSGSGGTLNLQRASDGALSWAGGGMSAEELAADRKTPTRFGTPVLSGGGGLSVMPMPWGQPTPEERSQVETQQWLDTVQAQREQARIADIERRNSQAAAKEKFQIGADAAAAGRSIEDETATRKAAEQAMRSQQAIMDFDKRMKTTFGEPPTDPQALEAYNRQIEPVRKKAMETRAMLLAISAAMQQGGADRVTQEMVNAISSIFDPRVLPKSAAGYTQAAPTGQTVPTAPTAPTTQDPVAAAADGWGTPPPERPW